MADSSFPPLRTTVDDAAADLRHLGCCAIGDVLDENRLDRLRSVLDGLAAEEREAQTAWFSNGNQRVFALPNKSPVWLELMTHPVAVQLAACLLGADALLSSMTANVALPGNDAQTLHADQQYMTEPWPWAATINVVWLLDDFFEANGSTRVVPGSHMIGVAPRNPDFPTVSVVAPAGSVLGIDGRVWHGTGRNASHRARRGVFAYYCAPFLRQQENPHRSLPRAVRESLTPEERRILGFDIWNGLGTVGGLPTEWTRRKSRTGAIP